MPVSAMNPLTNFGHEYVWHCHILGHEEFDLMRPLVLNTDNLLYADLASGLWQWDGSAWSQLTPNDPLTMLASGSILFADFGTGDLRVWDGTGAWTQITPNNPTIMVAGF